MRNTKKIVASLVAVGALAASGTAFTSSNTVAASVAGYGTSTISGANATEVKYTLSADGTTINGAALKFQGDLTAPIAKIVKAGFGTDALTSCVVGGYDAVNLQTPVTCSGFSQNTATSASFNVAVAS
jgi:hypothetical protein